MGERNYLKQSVWYFNFFGVCEVTLHVNDLLHVCHFLDVIVLYAV